MRLRRYPPRASMRQIEGTVLVAFELDASGKVLARSIERSSGHDILDEAALSLIDRASPMPAPPPELARGGSLRFSVPIGYRLR